jgi:hypothetical protein
MPANGNVFICGGDVAQGVCEVFVVSPGGNDPDGDGFDSINLTGTSFVQITAAMQNTAGTAQMGRVNHTVTVLPGAPNRVVIVGGKDNNVTAVPADNPANSAHIFSYNAGSPALSTFGTPQLLGRQGIELHTATLIAPNGNVLIIRGHTAQIFFSQ